MEGGVFPPCLDQFMLSPLVTWVKTFMPHDEDANLDFSVLIDGVILNDIMMKINPWATPQAANEVSGDVNQRIQNLRFLVQQIKAYYRDNLRQLILIPMPNVLLLGWTPYCEQSLEEIRKVLLLLLGCAVQCEKKEEYIQRIQTLSFDTKAAIAAHIQELIHSQENMLDLQWLESREVHPDELEATARNMATHLQHLLDQRDTYLETIAELMLEKDGVVGLLNSHSISQPTSYSPSMQQVGTQQHLAVELADSKAKIRRLRQQVEEKSEQMLDCRHELENMEAELKRIQQENAQLLGDARAARTYRDELDALRERAIKADKLETEVGRYRDQLHKMEFYKTKVEELKEDNRVLQETKDVLGDQLAGWRARSDQIHHLEKHNLLLKAQIDDMEQVTEALGRRVEELQNDNLALCLAQRRSMEESQHLGWELEQLSKTTENPQGQRTLNEEVSESTLSRMLKLEQENQGLLRTIEELRHRSVNGGTTPDRGRHPGSGRVVCGGDSCTSSTDEPTVFQNSCSNAENCSDAFQKCTVTQQMLNGECHQHRVQDKIPLRDNPHLHIQEKGELKHRDRADHLKELTPDPENLELHCFAESCHHSFVRSHDSILTGPPPCSSYASKHTQQPEAKCRALNAVNQHLQTSLDNSARRPEAEVRVLGAENQSLQPTLEDLQISARRREQVETEKRSLEQETTVLEREERQLEKENRRLRQQELVNEKLRTHQRDNELERLVHGLEMKDSTQHAEQEAPDNSRLKMLELELEASLRQSLQIKEDKMAALEARLQESFDQNQQLGQELKTVRLSYEAHRQRHEEELTASRAAPPGETGGTMSEWLRENQEATKELLRLKDRLIDVERNNATLEAECQATRGQLKQLEGQSNSQRAQILALQRQTASLQENNTALQKHNANLQVEKSTLNSQGASLMAQNAQLLQQRSGVASERDSAVREREELRGVYEQLLRDRERLGALHEHQAMESEALMGKHGCLKNAHRTLELEHRTLQDRYNSLLQQRTKLEDQEKALNEEQVRMTLEREQHKSTSAECCRLRDEKDWLNQTYRQLLHDNELLTTDHKQLKSQLNETKLKHAWLEADFSKLQKEFQQLDITSTKLTNQCELLEQLKGNLEEENRHLLSQIDSLMLQNQTLLKSKEVFHVEERQYIDQLNDLRRHKEKLEEKIMDQYKYHEPSTPRRQGSWIALKLKKLIKPGVREHRQSLQSPGSAEPLLFGHDDSSVVSSVVSSDGGSSSATAGDATSPRRSGTTLKRFAHIRSRSKDKGKVKSLSRRSMSLSSLLCPMALFEEEPWAGSSERLEGSDADVEEDRRNLLSSSLPASILSILHLDHPTNLPSDHVTATSTEDTDTGPEVSELWLPDKDSHDSTTPSGFEDNEELQNLGLNGVQSRAQSESSCEFNLSLENEPWSNGSSPVQQPPSRRSSSSYQPPSDASSPKHALRLQQQHKENKENKDKASTTLKTGSLDSDIQCTPKQRDPGLSEDFWLRRGTKSIRRGSRGKVTRHSLDSGATVEVNSGLNGINAKSSSSKAETTQASAYSPITVLYVQGKSSSMSGCLNCFSTPLGKEGRLKGPRSPKSLPRASSVISTAEGLSRRSSVNSDCRVTVRNAPPSGQVSEEINSQEETVTLQQPEQDTNNSEPESIPPVKPPRDPKVVVPSDRPEPPVQESPNGSSFTLNSVFSNTIFSDSGVTTTTSQDALGNSQTLLCPNPARVQKCPLESQESPPNMPQTLHSMENAEHAAELDQKNVPLPIA